MPVYPTHIQVFFPPLNIGTLPQVLFNIFVRVIWIDYRPRPRPRTQDLPTSFARPASGTQHSYLNWFKSFLRAGLTMTQALAWKWRDVLNGMLQKCYCIHSIWLFLAGRLDTVQLSVKILWSASSAMERATWWETAHWETLKVKKVKVVLLPLLFEKIFSHELLSEKYKLTCSVLSITILHAKAPHLFIIINAAMQCSICNARSTQI